MPDHFWQKASFWRVPARQALPTFALMGESVMPNALFVVAEDTSTSGDAHAAPVGDKSTTLCGRPVEGLRISDEDWVTGSLRVKCDDCLRAFGEEGVEWVAGMDEFPPTPTRLRPPPVPHEQTLHQQ